MARFSFPLALVAIVFVFATGAAQAAQDHSWVSSTGSGTTCSRATPCGNFATAHDATNPGGIISVLDPGDYLQLFISKSLTIRAEGVDGGHSAAAIPVNWIVITTGPSDVVTLEGLHLNGGGITFDAGGISHVVPLRGHQR